MPSSPKLVAGRSRAGSSGSAGTGTGRRTCRGAAAADGADLQESAHRRPDAQIEEYTGGDEVQPVSVCNIQVY